MGMYTQVRGWLNVNSIAEEGNEKTFNTFNRAVKEYNEENRTPRQEYVLKDTSIQIGANSSVFIFIGTELKNYDADAEKWLEFLISKFYNAEGHIMFQYEENETKNKIWTVSNGKINEKFEDFDFKGYGNMYESELDYNQKIGIEDDNFNNWIDDENGVKLKEVRKNKKG